MVDQCPGEPSSQVRIQALLILKRGSGNAWLLQTWCMNSLLLESFVLAALHLGQIRVNLQQANVIFYSVSCYLYTNGKVIISFKVRALRIGSPVYFRI